MKRFSEQLHTKALSVKLRASERAELRERVTSYMEYHPLPAAKKVTNRRGTRATTQADFQYTQLSIFSFLRWSGIFTLILLLGVSYTAERAVPGDALYAVKVSFNEEVRSTLARSPYEKVVWETERMNRRIAEARYLASEGRLTEVVEAAVANAVRTHSDNARREIATLKQTDSDGAALASVQLNTALDVQSKSLQTNTEGTSAEGKSTALISSVVEESLKTSAAEVPAELPSYQRLMAQVERDTTRAYELLETIEGLATPTERKDVSRRLEDIERSIADVFSHSGDDTDSARPALFEILQRTQRLIVFMTNIDVRSNVTVETIVPVVLTKAERIKMIEDSLAEITLILSTITEAEPTDESVDEERVALGVSQIASLFSLATTSLATEDFAAGETAAAEALVIGADLLTMLGLSLDESAPNEPIAPIETGTSTDAELPEEGQEGSETGTSTDETATTTNEQEMEV